MAIAVRSERRRHVRHRPPLMRQREAEPGAYLALMMVALAVVGIVMVGLAGQLMQVTIPRVYVSSNQPPGFSRPVDGAVPEAKQFSAAALSSQSIIAAPAPAAALPPVDAAPAPPAMAAAAPPAPDAPSARVLAVGGRAKVVNTDGLGVVLYAAPRPGGRQPAGLLEGTVVTVLELADAEWTQVRSDAKQTGWVHSEYLAPAD